MSPHTSCNVEFSMRSRTENVTQPESPSVTGMRDWMLAARDLAVVAAFQIILRTTLMLRRWNY
jgi:hypothetical protein